MLCTITKTTSSDVVFLFFVRRGANPGGRSRVSAGYVPCARRNWNKMAKHVEIEKNTEILQYLHRYMASVTHEKHREL